MSKKKFGSKFFIMLMLCIMLGTALMSTIMILWNYFVK